MAESIFAQILRIADGMGFAKDPFDRPVKMYPRPVGEPKEPNLVYGEPTARTQDESNE